MVAQAFAYNVVFFTYAPVVGRFYGVPPDDIGLYLLPFAFGNLLGPIVLGPLFDLVGRRAMIATTYALTGVLDGYLIGAGLMLGAGLVAAFLALPAEQKSLEEIAAMPDRRPERSQSPASP